MYSTRERVSFPGVLRGQGHEATCTIYATKVSLPGTSASAITDCDIVHVSKVLPEGIYELVARGETTKIRFKNGFWLSADI